MDGGTDGGGGVWVSMDWIGFLLDWIHSDWISFGLARII